MDMPNVSATAGLVANATADNPIGVVMLKKAMQVDQQTAMALIDSLPPPATATDPNATLGRNIDVKV